MVDTKITYDLAGRIANLNWRPSSEWAVPILEAVSNSLHATEELAAANRKIEIALIREGDDQATLLVDSQKDRPIVGFRVKDNGIGFTDENYNAFLTIDSRHKESKGGKGIGRLFWLKVFEVVTVKSVYADNGTRRYRGITFTKERLTPEGPSETSQDIVTEIEVKGLKHNYREHYKKYGSTLVKEIANEFLPYFILKGWPGHFTLSPTEKGSEQIGIKDSIHYLHSYATFEICGVQFKVNHIINYSTDTNVVTFCASGRAVNKYKVDIGDTLPRKVFRDEEGKPFSYICMLESEYLDAKVSTERTHFNIPDNTSELLSGIDSENIDKATIVNRLKSEIETFLKPYLSVMAQDTAEVIKSVQLSHPELKLLECTDEDLRGMLGATPIEVKKRLRLRLHELEDTASNEMDELIKRLGTDTPIDYAEFSRNYAAELERYTSVGQSKLIAYVVYRKHVLTMLKAALEATPSGATAKEEIIHRIIFPMQVEGPTFDFGSNHNLWVIDDRLATTDWIASDLAISKHGVLYSSDEGQEPDIVCYNLAYADDSTKDAQSRFAEIHIVEFKRPFVLSAKRDPIQQIKDYVFALKTGKAFRLVKVKGEVVESARHVTVSENARFYGYALFDQHEFGNKEVWDRVVHNHNLQEFMNGFICQLGNISILVMSYNALIDTAAARHAVFFNKISGISE